MIILKIFFLDKRSMLNLEFLRMGFFLLIILDLYIYYFIILLVMLFNISLIIVVFFFFYERGKIYMYFIVCVGFYCFDGSLLFCGLFIGGCKIEI